MLTAVSPAIVFGVGKVCAAGDVMSIELKTTYRNFSPPLQAKKRIRRCLENMAEFCPDIVSCDVVAEKFHGHQLEGHRYRVAIAVVLADGEILADHDHHNEHESEDFFVAVEAAFDALARVLRRHANDKAGVD